MSLRADRVHAALRVLTVLIGRADASGFAHACQLAEVTGLGPWRTSRALADLKAARIIVPRRCGYEAGIHVRRGVA